MFYVVYGLQCLLEGFYDAEQQIIYIQLISAHDSAQLAKLCQRTSQSLSHAVSQLCEIFWHVVSQHWDLFTVSQLCEILALPFLQACIYFFLFTASAFNQSLVLWRYAKGIFVLAVSLRLRGIYLILSVSQFSCFLKWRWHVRRLVGFAFFLLRSCWTFLSLYVCGHKYHGVFIVCWLVLHVCRSGRKRGINVNVSSTMRYCFFFVCAMSSW